MQILHYCARLRLKDGGVVRAVLDLTTALAQRGKTVTLMATEGNDWPESDTKVQTVQSGPFDRWPIRFSRKKLTQIRRHIEQADVLHLHTPWEPANIQMANIARACGTPYVISIHGMLDRWVMRTSTLKKRLFLSLGGRKMLHKASAVHCTAQAEVTQIIRLIPKSTLDVIPLVFDPSNFLNPPPTSDPDKHWPQGGLDKPIILFLSRLHPKKGVDRLIRAAVPIVEAHNARFIIAGNGTTNYNKQLRALVKELNLISAIDFVGFVEGDRKTALYRAADIFVLPTSQENFGLVLPEAMACSVPVITTKGVDIWPELEESGGAIIIDDDIESITNAIRLLLSDDEKKSMMGQSGRKWVDSVFSGDAIVNRYIDLYRKSINQ